RPVRSPALAAPPPRPSRPARPPAVLAHPAPPGSGSTPPAATPPPPAWPQAQQPGPVAAPPPAAAPPSPPPATRTPPIRPRPPRRTDVWRGGQGVVEEHPARVTWDRAQLRVGQPAPRPGRVHPRPAPSASRLGTEAVARAPRHKQPFRWPRQAQRASQQDGGV